MHISLKKKSLALALVLCLCFCCFSDNVLPKHNSVIRSCYTAAVLYSRICSLRTILDAELLVIQYDLRAKDKMRNSIALKPIYLVKKHSLKTKYPNLQNHDLCIIIFSITPSLAV